MTPPTYQKEIYKFIVLVNCYLNMWARHSHTLVALNKLTPSVVKFKMG